MSEEKRRQYCEDPDFCPAVVRLSTLIETMRDILLDMKKTQGEIHSSILRVVTIEERLKVLEEQIRELTPLKENISWIKDFKSFLNKLLVSVFAGTILAVLGFLLWIYKISPLK